MLISFRWYPFNFWEVVSANIIRNNISYVLHDGPTEKYLYTYITGSENAEEWYRRYENK